VEVCSAAYPDASQFDRKSEYYDAQSSRSDPRWLNVDVKLVKKARFVPLAALRAHPELAGMRVLQRANRLSITPVTPAEWKFVTGRLMKERL
jgi:predicted RNA-binding protein with PUA-like domain